MSELYIGLISGTSADGIDAALVDFASKKPTLLETHQGVMSAELKKSILALNQPGENEINRLGELDHQLGKAFAKTANELIKKAGIDPSHVRAIGSHGQTIRHHPDRKFTLQIADPNIIAHETSITTVADFRRRDIANGGQGAPLVPGFHRCMLATSLHDRAIVNIGGVANITILPANPHAPIIGYDTGPGNNLMDRWIEQQRQQPYDKNGAWAAQGSISNALLQAMLKDPYFKKATQKSTGPEYFNLAWLNHLLLQTPSTPEDTQATLAELTALTILNAIRQHMTMGDILVCGGGAHNNHLMQRLTTLANPMMVKTTEAFGIHPDWMEAMAFAWLAKQTLEKKPGNLTEVTGASQATILGGVYYSNHGMEVV